jgi:hypothetical protein
MEIDPYNTKIETKQLCTFSHSDPRHYLQESSVDQTKSRSRARAVTKLGTSESKNKIGMKRDKSTNSVSDYQKSRLSVASRSHYGVSGMSSATPGYLGGGKKKEYVKAENFGIRSMVRRSNFPTASTIIKIKQPVKKEQSSPEVVEKELPEFKIEENAYLQNKFSPRMTAGRVSKKNLALISPRPGTSILPTNPSCFSSSGFSRSKLQSGARSRPLLPAIAKRE